MMNGFILQENTSILISRNGKTLYSILHRSLDLTIFIILIFNFNINKEINETSENQITSIKHAIEQHDNVNQGHDYFIVKSIRL